MRTGWWWLVAGALAAASSAQVGAHPVRVVRSVQLIAMATIDAPEEAGPASGRGGNPPPGAAHDLRRLWVEHQLLGAVAEMPSMLPDSVAPEAYQQSSADVARRSSIVVPAWMAAKPLRVWERPYAPACANEAYRPSGMLRPDAELRRRGYFPLVRSVACDYRIPLGLFDALIIRESGYNPAIVSPKFAFGLTQLMSGTARALGVDRYDIEGNLRGGARYLRRMLDNFGQYHLALAAYNAGPGRVRLGVAPQIPETQSYVRQVIATWLRLSGQAGMPEGGPVRSVVLVASR